MAYRDLRAFLARLEEADELVRISIEVDPVFEVAAVCRKVLNDGGPAVRFDRLKGQRMPLVSNIVATRARFAMALETSPEDLASELMKRMAKTIAPVVVKDAVCKENVISGKDVNLYDLPIPSMERTGRRAFSYTSLRHQQGSPDRNKKRRNLPLSGL